MKVNLLITVIFGVSGEQEYLLPTDNPHDLEEDYAQGLIDGGHAVMAEAENSGEEEEAEEESEEEESEEEESEEEESEETQTTTTSRRGRRNR